MKKTKLKTITLFEDTTAVFSGSDGLKIFMFRKIKYEFVEYKLTETACFHIDFLRDDNLIVPTYLKKELDLLIKEMSERNINYLTIFKSETTAREMAEYFLSNC